MLNKETAEKILKEYGEAWTLQDTSKILNLFALDGVYSERAFEKPFVGHEEIANYWNSKVCEEQSNIKFKILNYYISGNVIVAEWDVSFDSNIKNCNVHIQSVAIFEVENNKIKKFREYWHKEK
ncbi:MAG: nuclear transport factor 2 family protein [Candidatus Nanoarchaeia archaeon]